jgi:hypothetical protein
MRAPQLIAVNEDSRLVPAWSMLAAAAAFVLVEYGFWGLMPHHMDHPQPPFGLRIYFGISWGLVAALYFLVIGYISKDAPRRAMSYRLWILICFVLPMGIGAVLYFLLRVPLDSRCSACGTHVQGDFNFCPQCHFQLIASCGTCFCAVRPTDQYCPRCGHELANDRMPARLRVLGE